MSYGRRLRFAPRRFFSGPRVAVNRSRQAETRRAPAVSAPIFDATNNIEYLESILADYASCNTGRVPRSAFCEVSSPETLQCYTQFAEGIASFRRKEAQRRDQKIATCRVKSASLASQAKALSDAANNSETHKATMLSDAAGFIEKSLSLLESVATWEKNYDMVFVYDIDEITMLSRNYIAEFSTMFPEIDSYALFKFTGKVIGSVNFTPKEIIGQKLISTYYDNDDGSDYWRRVAPKYAALEQLYNVISTGYRNGDPDINKELCNKCNIGEEIRHLRKTVAQIQKRTHKRWRHVKKCLEFVNRKSRSTPGKYANIVLTAEGAAYGAAQLLVSGHSSQIPMENIYSVAKFDREKIVKLLEKRFGETCVFVYVSSQTTAVDNPQLLQWPVEAADSIKKLYRAQKKHFF